MIFIQWLLNQSWNYDIHLSLIYDEIVLTCNNDIVIVKNRYEVIKAQLFVNWIILQSVFFWSLAIRKLLVDHRFNVSVCFDVCILYCNICVAFIISSLPLKRWPICQSLITLYSNSKCSCVNQNNVCLSDEKQEKRYALFLCAIQFYHM